MKTQILRKFSLAGLLLAFAGALGAETLYDYATEYSPVSKTYYVSVPSAGTVDSLIVTYTNGTGSAYGTMMVIVPGTGLVLQTSASGGSIAQRHVTGLPVSINGQYMVMHIGGASGFASSASFTTSVTW